MADLLGCLLERDCFGRASIQGGNLGGTLGGNLGGNPEGNQEGNLGGNLLEGNLLEGNLEGNLGGNLEGKPLERLPKHHLRSSGQPAANVRLITANQGSSRCCQVSGWGGVDVHDIACVRMSRPQLPRVQQRSVCASPLFPVPVGIAVHRIPEDGASQVLHVHPDLMGSPRSNAHRHQREPTVTREPMDYAERSAATPLLRHHAHLEAIDRVSAYRLGDRGELRW
jgi:hypothetical protein